MGIGLEKVKDSPLPPVSLPIAKSSHSYAPIAAPLPADEVCGSWYPSPRGSGGVVRFGRDDFMIELTERSQLVDPVVCRTVRRKE